MATAPGGRGLRVRGVVMETLAYGIGAVTEQFLGALKLKAGLDCKEIRHWIAHTIRDKGRD